MLAALLLAPIASAFGSGMQMVGEARLQFMFWPVYDSRLYSLTGAFQEGQRPLRLEIEYLRAVDSSDLVEHTRKEWERTRSLTTAEREWLQVLARLWPDVGRNDILAFELDGQGVSTFALNGQVLGEIDDPAFGERFVAIWLSPETSRPEMRLSLLGRD